MLHLRLPIFTMKQISLLTTWLEEFYLVILNGKRKLLWIQLVHKSFMSMVMGLVLEDNIDFHMVFNLYCMPRLLQPLCQSLSITLCYFSTILCYGLSHSTLPPMCYAYIILLNLIFNNCLHAIFLQVFPHAAL